MHPLIYEIPIGNGIPIFSYGFMVMLAFLSGTWLAVWRGKSRGIEPDSIIDLGIVTMIAGVVGGRTAYFLENPDEFELGFKYFQIWKGGMTLYGGLILAIVAAVIYMKKKELGVLKMLDLLAPTAMLGLSIGRIGCFLNGCCWGTQCSPDKFYAVQFPAYSKEVADAIGGRPAAPALLDHYPDWFNLAPQSRPEWSHAVVNTQIISVLGAASICLFLLFFAKKARRQGQVIALMGCVYSVWRFIIEFWRADNIPESGWMTFSQGISLSVSVASLGFFWWASRYGEPVKPLAVPPPHVETEP